MPEINDFCVELAAPKEKQSEYFRSLAELTDVKVVRLPRPQSNAGWGNWPAQSNVTTLQSN